MTDRTPARSRLRPQDLSVESFHVPSFVEADAGGTTDTLGRDCTYPPMCPPTHTTTSH